MPSRIGLMRNRILLINPLRTDNGRGGWSLSYDEDAPRSSVWSEIRVVSKQDRFRYREAGQEITLEARVRVNPFIKTDTRIYFNKTLYEIDDITPDEEEQQTADPLYNWLALREVRA